MARQRVDASTRLRPKPVQLGRASLLLLAPTLLLVLLCCFDTCAFGQESLDIEQIAERDLYAVLDLPARASDLDVKAAYRKLARKWHPDKNPDDTQTAQDKFAEIAEAYEILSDDTSRQLYDHARRVRAAHEFSRTTTAGVASAGAGPGDGGRRGSQGGFAGDWETGDDWFYFDDDGLDDLGGFFGSSFGGGGAAFGPTFGRAGGAAGGTYAYGGGTSSRGFEFHVSDPMELFEAFFGGGGFDGPDADPYQDHDLHQDQRRYEHQHQQRAKEHPHRQEQQQGSRQGAGGIPWVGQDYEQYHDYEDEGRLYRRVITTVVHGDGSTRSTAQDFVFDTARDTWAVASGPYEYRGPGVAPGGSGGKARGGCSGDGRGAEAVDNVLRMNEFLRVGHAITSVDRRFTAVLEADCNLVVYRHRGRGKESLKAWETASFDPEGECFATIQDNGMFVVMAGSDPSMPGNVLWSSNQGHVGWIKQNTFHASVHANGNLVVSQGESPMHRHARHCVWGAFGCPGDGGVMEWKLVWMSFRSRAGLIWCKIVGCGDGENDLFDAGDAAGDHFNAHGNGTRESVGRSRTDAPGKGRKEAAGEGSKARDVLEQMAGALKGLADRGLAKLKEGLAKVKSAAEETAYAASRPRHW